MKNKLLVVLALALGFLVSAQPAQADQIDQSFLTCCQFNIGTYGPNRMLGQTFTAGLTGQLTSVSFALLTTALYDPATNTAIGPGTVTISIRDVVGGIPGSTVLGSTTVNGSFNSSTPISFSSAGIFVLAGTQYAIVIQSAPNSQATWRGMLGDLYAGGGAFDTGCCPGPLQAVLFNGQGIDFSFETRVNVVPEPGTLLLLGTGLVGLFSRRKHN